MLVYHVATAADWARARRDGVHTTSTRGRTLEQEGFIHASRADQWRGVHARFYADVGEPLVLLEIDTDRLGCPVVEEPGEPGGTETFPHIQGPVPVTAVLLIVLSAIGAVAVGGVDGGSETLVGAAAGLAVGLLLMWLVLRRGRPRT